jgi:hypothetical protein
MRSGFRRRYLVRSLCDQRLTGTDDKWLKVLVSGRCVGPYAESIHGWFVAMPYSKA